ncbi:MAG: LCP family protein [Candidatus Daviesbacteria bacterium]|nr:LCP family protein [Candidatus Daviesbacteria bacterium]
MKKIIKKIVIGLAVFAIFVGLMFLWSRTTAAPEVFSFVFGPKSFLTLEDDRLNVLLLGMAGGTHDGATLTDTVMVASYNTKTKTVKLISLPRDFWIEKHNKKINALYQMGLNEDQGLSFTRGEVGEILGINIPYAVRVDFSGFVKAVDTLGGIEVKVSKSFDDYFYPVPGREKDLCDYSESLMEVDEDKARELGVKSGQLKVLLDKDKNIATLAAEPAQDIAYTDHLVFKFFPCRFEHLNFKAGMELMDGERALKYVRSRHGSGEEGSDFARSKRQQLVIQAFGDKALSTKTLLNPQKVVNLLQTLGASVDSDVPSETYLEIGSLVRQARGVSNIVVDASNKDSLLVVPPVGRYGAFVVVPRSGDYFEIHQYIKDSLSKEIISTPEATLK